MANKDHVALYLAKYAEPEATGVRSLLSSLDSYSASVVVPLYRESERIETLRGSIERASPGKLIWIAVVNARVDDPAGREDNRRLMETVASWGSTRSIAPGFLLTRTSYADVLVVDRTTEGRCLPPKGGVGHARKIGTDLASALFHQGRLNSPWLRQTDGDAQVPADYFRDPATEGAAALYPFVHQALDPNEAEAIRAYDFLLRYYEAGLAYAASPYAFQTVGSTIIVHARAYAVVRGYARREAGEDFYLLNKLRKVGEILTLHRDPIVLSGRASDRVPFGTGRAVRKFLAEEFSYSDYPVYAPSVFEVLRLFLASIRTEADAEESFTRALEERFVHAEAIAAAVVPLGLFQARAALSASGASPDQLERRFDEYFDAFRTRKFIHALRDGPFPNVALSEAALAAPFLSPPSDSATLHA